MYAIGYDATNPDDSLGQNVQTTYFCLANRHIKSKGFAVFWQPLHLCSYLYGRSGLFERILLLVFHSGCPLFLNKNSFCVPFKRSALFLNKNSFCVPFTQEVRFFEWILLLHSIYSGGPLFLNEYFFCIPLGKSAINLTSTFFSFRLCW